jgi:hypothetical protein
MGQFIGQKVELVWNKGIAALCDWRFPDEFPDGKSYSPVPEYAGALWSFDLPDSLISDPSACRKIEDGDLVWVRLSWLRSFVRQVLPLVKANFVLVTGDSDSCVPSELGPEARAVLDCSKVVHWYTQDYDGSGPLERISPVPIGIDFHMISERPFWGEAEASALEQERTLVSIGKSFPPLQARLQRVYADFGWQRGFGRYGCYRDFGVYRRFHPLEGTSFHESRRQLLKELRRNELVYCQPGPLPRREMWRRQGEYAFVLSPHGHMGLDSQRTWEALALGHIVLAPSSSVDSLYVDLPVVPLKSWNEITPENLEKWLSLYSNDGATHEKLRSSYWVNQMRSRVQERCSRQAAFANVPVSPAL